MRTSKITEWKPIEGFESFYDISVSGEVFSLRTGRCLKLQVSNKGYLVVHTTVHGVQKTLLVHRLVAKAFIDNPLNLDQVNHKNGDKKDNHVSNLEWCSASENQIHARKKGLNNSFGERSHLSKLTTDDLIEIKKLSSSGKTQKEIASKFGVSQSNISLILNNKTWNTNA